MILIITRETLLIAAHTDMEIVFASIVAMRGSFVMAINGNIINNLTITDKSMFRFVNSTKALS